jgi:hypothetical protein
MTDILQEVLNDQNDEKILSYFKKLLPIVIVCTAVVVLFMLWANWHKNKMAKNNQRTSNILIQSVSSINSDQEFLQKSLKDLIENSGNKVGELASIEQIGIVISQGNSNDAKNLLDKIINNKDYSELTTAYARLVWLSLVIDEQNIGSVDRNKVEKYLSYFDTDDKAFFGTANIIKAIWYMQNDASNMAKNTLEKIMAAENVTPMIKEQAAALLSNL